MRRKIFLFSIILLLVIGFLAWQQSPQWLESFNETRAEEAKQYRAKGLALGEVSDQDTCVTRALSAYASCTDSTYACTVNQGIQLKACLEVAQPSENFCADVPEFNEKATEEEKTWARYGCWDADIAGDGCRLLLRQKQQFCSQ